MDYRKEVAAIAVIDIEAFELAALAEAVGETLTNTFGQLVQWIAYGNIGNIKNTMGTEKAKTWLDWSLQYGEGLQAMIRSMEYEMDAERFNSFQQVKDVQDDGLLAMEFRYDVTVH